MNKKSRMILVMISLLMPMAGMAQQELSEEQEFVYQVLQEFDSRSGMPYSLADDYLRDLTASPTNNNTMRKAESEKVERTIHIGADERLQDLLDVPVNEIDVLKLTGFVHQEDLNLIKGYYANPYERTEDDLPLCYEYKFSHIDLGECEIEDGIIPDHTFADKLLLEEVVLPEGLREIGDGAFYMARALKSVNLPSTLERIGRTAFYDTAIESVDLPEPLTDIGELCFAFSAVKSMTMAEAPLVCGNNIFFSSDLEKGTLPDDMTEIPLGMFQSTPLKDLVIPEGVTTIGPGAFNACHLFTPELPESLERIGHNAFCSTGIKNLVIPDGVVEIDSLAFKYCMLRSVTIGESVESIGLGCFATNKLQYVYCKAMQPPFVPEAVEGNANLTLPFDYNYSESRDAVLLVPKGTKHLYESAHCWKDFSRIEEVGSEEDAQKWMEHTGIEGFTTSDASSTAIYDLNGVRMRAKSISELPAGVYIVGGKKVVVR